jgi:hypothetical protein
LLFRKTSHTGSDGLPRAIECGHQDTDGARIKDIIAEKVAHFGASDAPSRIRMHETAAVADRVATFIESSVTEKPS